MSEFASSGIIISNLKTDGYGAQLLAKVSAWAFCYEHNFKYMHTPIEKCHHTQSTNLDDFFKIKSTFDDSEIDINNLEFENVFYWPNECDRDWPTIKKRVLINSFTKNFNFAMLHWFNSYYSDKYYSQNTRNELRKMYDDSASHENSSMYLFLKNTGKYDKIISIHVRKNDVTENTKYNFNPENRIIYDETYFNFVRDMKNKYKDEKLAFIFHTDGKEDQLNKIYSFAEKENDIFINKENMEKTFHDFVNSDILFISISAFSYIPALINKNDIYYVENYMYHALPHWHNYNNIHKKLFVVLEQGCHPNGELAKNHKKEFTTDFSDFYRLNWNDDKTDQTANFFAKGITWSQGRSTLYEKVAGKYQYYIFIDDDIKFLSSQERSIAYEIKYLLEKYKPLSATTWNTLFDNNSVTKKLAHELTRNPMNEKEAFPVYYHDLCVHIFQEDFADLMFPIYFHGSEHCQHYAQFIAHKLFPDKIMAFRTFMSKNLTHDPHCDQSLKQYNASSIVVDKFSELLNSDENKDEFKNILYSNNNQFCREKNTEVYELEVSDKKVSIDKNLLASIISVDHIKSPKRW